MTIGNLADHVSALQLVDNHIHGFWTAEVDRQTFENGLNEANTEDLGDFDSVDAEAFRSALQRIWPLLSDDEILVDARDVKFIGHRHLLELEWSAHADGRTVVLQDAPRIVTRLVDLLHLNHVRVKPATSAS